MCDEKVEKLASRFVQSYRRMLPDQCGNRMLKVAIDDMSIDRGELDI